MDIAGHRHGGGDWTRRKEERRSERAMPCMLAARGPAPHLESLRTHRSVLESHAVWSLSNGPSRCRVWSPSGSPLGSRTAAPGRETCAVPPTGQARGFVHRKFVISGDPQVLRRLASELESMAAIVRISLDETACLKPR